MFDRQWVILRFRGVFPYLVLRYSDSSGGRGEARVSWSPSAPPDALIFDLLGSLQFNSAPGPHGGPGSSVALFVDFGQLWLEQDREQLAWHPRLQDRFPGAEPVLLSPARPLRRTPFRLPLRVLAVNPSDIALSEFLLNEWLYEGGVWGRGIRVGSCAPDGLDRALRGTGADILVLDRDLRIGRHLQDLPESRSPRLLMVLDPWPVPYSPRPEERIPRGMAELRVRASADGFINSVLHQIVHDQPLDAAVHLARQQINAAPGAARLTADPLTNQSLRLFDAFLHLQHENDRIAPLLARVEQFRPVTAGLRRAMIGPPDWSFTRETTGLGPMALMSAGLMQADQFVRTETAENYPTAQPAAAEDQRVVNVALRRLETEPRLSTMASNSTLKPGCEYEVGVSIGDRLAESLVTGPQPAIASLLPSPEDRSGHELEVAIHAKDFKLVSERVQRLRLPLAGPSEAVYFRIRPPRENGTAQLRLCIYYRNQLVQSYLLAAQIAATDDPSGREVKRSGTALGVRLEYSRSKDRPWDLKGVKERALSVGVNQGAKTHELIVKASQASGELALLPSTFDTEVNSLRTELNGLVADSSGYERIFQPVAAGAQPSADVAEAFRKLMRRGGELYRAFFGTASKSSSVRKAVDLVAGSSNQKIQVVRFDDHFVFPWTLLYDFPLPDERQGDPPLPLCLGQVVDANGVTVACSHTRKTSDFCVRGFWGVRHYVEELLVQGAGKATSISRPSKGPLRLVAASNLTESAALETALKTIESATEVGPPGGSALLDLLWADPPERPSILVFLAHLEKENKAGEPKGVRVFLGGTDWLTLNELSNRVTSGVAEWDDPRPIVMQMTCNSADVDAATLNHFLLQWNTAGAAAIVGTEAAVGAGIASRCARSLTQELWNRKALGEAVTGFRRSLVFEGNPLGFLFTAYGDVDLAVS